MRAFAQILLSIFFILAYLFLVFGIIFKFQLLDYNFWLASFDKHNVYQNLAMVSKTSFEKQVTSEGGKESDVQVLTDLITPANAKDVMDRNLKNFLDFANGKVPQIYVYLPIDKVPKNLIPASISGIKSDMLLSDLLTKFNFQDWQSLPFNTIYQLGKYSSYLFYGSLTLTALITVLMVLVLESGKRFVALGITFLLAGGITLGLINLMGTLSTVLSANFSSHPSLGTMLMGVVLSPVVSDVAVPWKTVGFAMMVLGVGLFFVRKPGYNSLR